MQVNVSDGLACSRAVVDAKVVAVRCEFGVQPRLYVSDESQECRLLITSQISEPTKAGSSRRPRWVRGRRGPR